MRLPAGWTQEARQNYNSFTLWTILLASPTHRDISLPFLQLRRPLFQQALMPINSTPIFPFPLTLSSLFSCTRAYFPLYSPTSLLNLHGQTLLLILWLSHPVPFAQYFLALLLVSLKFSVCNAFNRFTCYIS